MKFKFHSSPLKFSKFRALILLLFPIVVLLLTLIYQNVCYKNLLVNFQSSFNNCEYSKANNMLLTEQELNIFKNIYLDQDLNDFFQTKISALNKDLSSKAISDEEALSLLNEISRYGLNQNEVSDCFSLIDEDILSTNTYSNGVKLYEEKKFEDAIASLSKVSSASPNYSNSLKYLKLSKQALKVSVLNEVDNLAKDDFFTKALNYLKKYYTLFPNDSDLLSKEKEINTLKNEYLSTNSSAPASNNSIISSISNSNINKLNIASYTSYLIYVSLDDQKTYVYSGKSNKWNLQKSISCSTGIPGKDTPQGVYEIGVRGDWFFSKQFDQGAKYWLQFKGDDYLFHSLPFKEDKTTVDDWTLGKKASHGCIRLPIEDSKWLYDTIPSGTKVIIK